MSLEKNKICEWKHCDLVQKQTEIENWVHQYIETGIKELQSQYPNHHKDCLRRIFAERLQIHHIDLIGDLIFKNKIGTIEHEQRQQKS